MEPVFYTVVFVSAYVGDHREPFMKLCRCSSKEVLALLEQIVGNHPEIAMEVYHGDKDDEEI